jgi:spectrin beta
MKTGATGGKRINNIVMKIKAIEEQQESFETFSSSLLVWIRAKTAEMRGRDFSNTLEGIQADFKQFKDYRTVEKPPKLKEKVEIEATYFDIQIKLQELRQAPFVPPEGQRPHDIEQSWRELEKEEYGKEMSIKEELLRQEKLEQLAYKFERKSVLREGYLNEMIQVLSDPRYGSNLNQVGASVKKHEAISADILARQERFLDLKAMSASLRADNYHAHITIGEREEQIMSRWQQLLDLLKLHKDKLERYCTVIGLQREIETLSLTISTLHTEFSSTDQGIHLLDVQEKLHKFQLQESQVHAMTETIRKVGKAVRGLLAGQALHDNQAEVIQAKLAELETQFAALCSLTKQRQAALEDSHSFFQLIQVRAVSIGQIIITLACRTLRRRASGATRSWRSARRASRPRTCGP